MAANGNAALFRMRVAAFAQAPAAARKPLEYPDDKTLEALGLTAAEVRELRDLFLTNDDAFRGKWEGITTEHSRRLKLLSGRKPANMSPEFSRLSPTIQGAMMANAKAPLNGARPARPSPLPLLPALPALPALPMVPYFVAHGQRTGVATCPRCLLCCLLEQAHAYGPASAARFSWRCARQP